MGRKNPYKQGGLASPPPELDDDEPDDVNEDQDDDEPDDDEEDNDDAPAERTARRSAGGSRRATPAIQSGAGWVLGVLLWGWVGLPFFKGGPGGVKNILKAKFFNQAPDGSQLP